MPDWDWAEPRNKFVAEFFRQHSLNCGVGSSDSRGELKWLMRAASAGNIFGKILRGELPSYEVYADDHCYGFLDIYPQAPGHSLLIPRGFSENLFVADEDSLRRLLAAVRRLGPALQRATGAPGLTVLTNTGPEAGQMIEYLHWHLIPRHAGDSVSLHTLGAAADPAELSAMASRIRSELAE